MPDDGINIIWLGQNGDEDGGEAHGSSLVLEAGGYLLSETEDTFLLEGGEPHGSSLVLEAGGYLLTETEGTILLEG